MIGVEDLAYWYFRMNGFLTIKNFVVHPDFGRDQETDIDLVAVRLPFRAENLQRPMRDDPVLLRTRPAWEDRHRIAVYFVEVKTGLCLLNGPWTRPERRNMERALAAIGPLPRDTRRLAATSLYESGVFRDTLYKVSLACLGGRINEEIETRYPEVPQVTWGHASDFIYERFTAYRSQKASHGQWDETGRILWDVAAHSRSAAEFRRDLSRHLPQGALHMLEVT